MSKIPTTTIVTISSTDLDDLVVETYGRPYCYQQQDGCKGRGTEHISVPIELPFDFPNDTVPEQVNDPQMGVSFEAWLKRDPKKKGQVSYLGLWWQRNFYPSLDMILNDLHKRELIYDGEYTLIIDW